MPSGSSCGTSPIRASTSAQMRKIAPSSAATGSSLRWAVPTHSRATCGMIKPTNPIPPDAATRAPTQSATTTMDRARSRVGEIPSDCAVLSPIDSASRWRAQAISRTSEAATTAVVTRADPPLASVSEPRIQNSTARPASGSSEAKIRNEVSAWSTYPIETPARTSLVEVIWPPTRASRNTPAPASSAPTNALPASELVPIPEPNPKRIDPAASVEAPEVTPSR